MTPIFEATKLCLSFPGFELKDISLCLNPGSIMGLIGPSGAGKTTLMKLIMGQIQPAGGHLTTCGLKYPGDLKEIRCRIGFVAEDPPFLPGKRVEEIIKFASPYYPRWDSSRFNDLLREFDIDHRLKVEELSRGRKSLLSLAMALSHGADLLLLDEPASGLDAFRRRQVLRLMAEFVADGENSVIITTHQTEGLAPLADRMAILHHGQIILEGETEELLASWKWLRYRNGAVSREMEEAFVCRERSDYGSRGLMRNYFEVQDHLAGALANGDIQVGNATIDDILVSLTGGK
jgi:ABC-2 type transport system ATP-binding protein